MNFRESLRFASLLAILLPVLPARSSDAEEAIDLVLKAPMLTCRELSGGVRPPANTKDAAPEHDLIFFVVSGKLPDGSTIQEVAPKDGGHLKIANHRQAMILKNIDLWKGSLKEGEAATLVLSVREQDGHDSASEDLKEAAEVARQVDPAQPLSSLARIPVPEVLQAGTGENDHIGTILLRIRNEKGDVVLETEPGDHARYLKGFPANHPTERSFHLDGDHSRYELHLRVEED